VNAYVGSQARFLISPSASSWTSFIEHMMGAAAAVSLCCRCQHGRGLMRVLAAGGADKRELDAAVAQSAMCETWSRHMGRHHGDNTTHSHKSRV
jgi:hypothetical protein